MKLDHLLIILIKEATIQALPSVYVDIAQGRAIGNTLILIALTQDMADNALVHDFRSALFLRGLLEAEIALAQFFAYRYLDRPVSQQLLGCGLWLVHALNVLRVKWLNNAALLPQGLD